MNIDQAIGRFNLDQEKNYTLAEADAYRRKGKMALSSGWSNGLVSAMSGVAQYQMYKGGITTAGTVKDTTFDSVYKPPALRPSYNPIR
jgi:hypothetical protein